MLLLCLEKHSKLQQLGFCDFVSKKQNPFRLITAAKYTPTGSLSAADVARGRLRNRHLFACDAISLVLTCAVAYSARFEGFSWVFDGNRDVFLWFIAIMVPVRLGLFWLAGLYRRVWSLASVAELERLLAATVFAGTLSILSGTLFFSGFGLTSGRMPIGVAVLDALLGAAVVILPRVSGRFLTRRRERRRVETRLPTALIVGAGSAGQMAARELLSQSRIGFRPIGFLDDEPGKRGLVVGDLPVVGNISELPQAAHSLGVRHVIIAMPSAPGTVIRHILQLARSAGLEARTVPSLHEMITRTDVASQLREIRIEDLLQRAPIETDTGAVRTLVNGRTVLVTGAGGSIGSELCRQLAMVHPARVVLVGRGENSIFEIQQELRTAFPGLLTVPVIVDVRDRVAMARVVRDHKPAVIFHAAAHKHVPLMEANVLEALRNNVLGTQSVVDAALAADVHHLVLISTDKAVRPASVMGASKRIAEQVVQIAARDSGHAYVCVRFGNVLGSRGSVVPTFLRQIRAGGPVLVTHPEMRRYFMTIPEAVQLVLQAFVLGGGGEVFCLDMGEPVPIVNLARDLIQLSGLEPDVDIEIRFTGARPGEKLYEEMFFGSEQAAPTVHPKVLRAKNTDVPLVAQRRMKQLLKDLEHGIDEIALRSAMLALVEDFGTDDPVSSYLEPPNTLTPPSLTRAFPESGVMSTGVRPAVNSLTS